jgi:hypothetical protein
MGGRRERPPAFSSNIEGTKPEQGPGPAVPGHALPRVGAVSYDMGVMDRSRAAGLQPSAGSDIAAGLALTAGAVSFVSARPSLGSHRRGNAERCA